MTQRRTVVAHLKASVARVEMAIVVALRCPEVTAAELKTMRNQLLALIRVTGRVDRRAK